MKKSEKEKMVPIWLKTCLTLEEASACTGIGVGRLKMLSQADDGKITIWIGNRRMFKRKNSKNYWNSQLLFSRQVFQIRTLDTLLVVRYHITNE